MSKKLHSNGKVHFTKITVAESEKQREFDDDVKDWVDGKKSFEWLLRNYPFSESSILRNIGRVLITNP